MTLSKYASLQIFLLLISSFIYGEDTAKEPSSPPPIGNFSLPPSQQPSKFVSLGENNIGKGQFLISVFADAIIGNNSYQTDVIPNFLYGITDDLTILLDIPFSPGNKYQDHHSSGMEDILTQLEYIIYSSENAHATDQATIIAGMTFPTGSSHKTPPTGFGASSFLIGGTYNHMTVDWYTFISPGVILTTTKHRTKFGDQFLYQFGVGRNIPSPKGWLYLILCEVDGTYARRNRFHGSIDHNSGGNIIYVTPSMWMSSERWIIQFGPGFPIVQNLNGHQSKKYISLNFSLTLTL